MAEYRADEHWSEVAGKAARRDRGGREVAGDDAPYYRYKRKLFLEKFLSQIPVEGMSVCEIGCGPGGNLVELLPRGPRRLVGCDVAPGMVDTARERLGDRAEVVQIDGEKLPFEDREFDITFTVTVLMHNPDSRMRRIAEEMCRITRSQVYLMEDTFPPSALRSTEPTEGGETGSGDYGSFFPRSVGQYADACSKDGFVPKQTEFLQTYASHALFSFLKSKLGKGRTAEGEGFSRMHWGIESTLQPVTRQLDRFIHRPAGELTLMRLERT